MKNETNSQHNVEDYMDIIKYHAYVCYRKLNSSSIYNFDDVVQEGCMIFIKAVKKYNSSNKNKGPFELYLKQSLRKSLGYFVQKSYRTLPQSSNVVNNEVASSSTNNPFKILNLLFIRQELKSNELNLLTLLTDPPQEFIDELMQNKRQVKKVVSKYLNVPTHQLRDIENNVKSVLMHA